jgi:DNA-binding MarR family transcriptional regulator
VADQPVDARLTNLVGALAVAMADRIRQATEGAAGHAAAAPAALVALDEFLDGRTMDHLRLAVGLTPSGAVRLVDRLAEQGLVERRPGADGRSVALVLTGTGRASAAQVRRARANAVGEMLGKLSVRDRQALTRIAERLLTAVTEERLAERARGDLPAGGWLCRLCDAEACGRPEGDCPTATAAAAVAVHTTTLIPSPR